MPHCGIVQTVTSNGERLKWGKGVHSRLAHRSPLIGVKNPAQPYYLLYFVFIRIRL